MADSFEGRDLAARRAGGQWQSGGGARREMFDGPDADPTRPARAPGRTHRTRRCRREGHAQARKSGGLAGRGALRRRLTPAPCAGRSRPPSPWPPTRRGHDRHPSRRRGVRPRLRDLHPDGGAEARRLRGLAGLRRGRPWRRHRGLPEDRGGRAGGTHRPPRLAIYRRLLSWRGDQRLDRAYPRHGAPAVLRAGLYEKHPPLSLRPRGRRNLVSLNETAHLRMG